MTSTSGLVAIARIPLVRNTAALVLNTGINGVLGLAYWIAAARLYEPATVGLGAGAVSGLLFVASLGWIGLQQVLLRFLPVAGSAAGRLIIGVYGTAIAIALLGGLAFLAFARTQPGLSFLTETGGSGLGFLTAVLIWVVFSLQDPALIAIGRAAWVPLENLAFGAAKLLLLFAFTGLAGPWAILGSWILGAGWLVLVVTIVIRRRIASGPPAVLGLRRIARFALGQHAVAVLVAAPDSLVPLIVLGLLGDESTAFYYAAWTISFSIRLLAVNLGSAVTVEGARRGSTMPDPHHIRRLVGLVVVPAVAVALLAAGFVMSIYGPRYAAAGTDLLRLLILAVVPFTGLTLFVVGERIAERVGASLAVVGLTTVLTLAIDVVFLPRIGLVAAGWAMLIAQSSGFLLGRAIGRSRAD
jgi:O-antigen/teichoic acid export membrane protein